MSPRRVYRRTVGFEYQARRHIVLVEPYYFRTVVNRQQIFLSQLGYNPVRLVKVKAFARSQLSKSAPIKLHDGLFELC